VKPTDEPPERRLPSIGVGVVTGVDRLDLARSVLKDLTHQTVGPSQVIVVLQEGMGGPDSDHSRRRALTEEFPDLPLSTTTNPGKGVSAARNIVLGRCTTDVLVLMDDDARMPDRALERIQSAFRSHPEAAVLTFKARWVGDDRRSDDYPRVERRRRTVMSVTSVAFIEMAVSMPTVNASVVRFDERLDLGTEFGTGGEFVFLADVIRRGGVVHYIPEEIAAHAARSSGQRLDRPMLEAKGAVYRRVFGPLGLAVGALLVGQKALSGQLECGPLVAFRGIIAGWRRFGRVADRGAATSAVS
jgi:hypothetical protein